MTGGGKKSGSGRGHAVNKAPARRGGRLVGAAAAARPKSARSASAKSSENAGAPRLIISKDPPWLASADAVNGRSGTRLRLVSFQIGGSTCGFGGSDEG
jgi:hypothetical protein